MTARLRDIEARQRAAYVARDAHAALAAWQDRRTLAIEAQNRTFGRFETFEVFCAAVDSPAFAFTHFRNARQYVFHKANDATWCVGWWPHGAERAS